MNYELYEKLLKCDFKELFEKKNYKYFDTGSYNLNIIGVRSTSYDRNVFDDLLVVTYKESRFNKDRFRIYPITTEPGTYYLRNPLHFKGTAILVPGQYCGCWKLGKHNGQYEALVQCAPVKVYRDNNKDDIYDLKPETVDFGVFGINIHRASANNKTKYVDKYSAGCQVFDDPKNFNSFMDLCRKQRDLYGNKFTYTLITEDDL